MKKKNTPRYAGFWIRVLATIIDTIILLAITAPILIMLYGKEYYLGTQLYYGPIDLLLNYLFPLIFSIVLWMKFKGTPGKIVLGLEVIDRKTGQALSLKQSVIRYLGYFLMILPLGLGFVLIAFDKKKQGWHDKMANSLVICTKS